ncbi:MAG: winged helix-turn-helix domain-containing protein [Methanomassiliicoccus sp.]|nr:winged helix-turn-helix domain-containing protein [Methanomassiliicoccus sp.]
MYFDIAQLACNIDSRKILSSIETTPRSAREIAAVTNLSVSRCYRMVKEMEQMNILSRTDPESRVTYYISNLRSVEISLEDDHLGLAISYRDGTRTELKMDAEDMERSAQEISQDLLAAEGSDEPSTVA